MSKEVIAISTLHISSGSFPAEIYRDNTGTVDIFGSSVDFKLVNNKLEVSDNISAKAFKRGAEERDYLLKWLKDNLKSLMS